MVGVNFSTLNFKFFWLNSGFLIDCLISCPSVFCLSYLLFCPRVLLLMFSFLFSLRVSIILFFLSTIANFTNTDLFSSNPLKVNPMIPGMQKEFYFGLVVICLFSYFIRFLEYFLRYYLGCFFVLE